LKNQKKDNITLDSTHILLGKMEVSHERGRRIPPDIEKEENIIII
jgi:hypothetical protein